MYRYSNNGLFWVHMQISCQLRIMKTVPNTIKSGNFIQFSVFKSKFTNQSKTILFLISNLILYKSIENTYGLIRLVSRILILRTFVLAVVLSMINLKEPWDDLLLCYSGEASPTQIENKKHLSLFRRGLWSFGYGKHLLPCLLEREKKVLLEPFVTLMNMNVKNCPKLKS